VSPRATARQSASRSSAPPRERSTDARVTERNDQTIALGALSARDVARVGGKNASLGEMIQHMTAAGIRVPDGFATTASAFWDFVGENRLREPIAATLALPGGRGYRLDLGQPGQLRRGEGDRRAGGPDPADADTVLREVGPHLALLLDGGQTPVGAPSTVLDCLSSPPRLLRVGAVSPAAIRDVVSVFLPEEGSPDPCK